ncbi:universal stress protein [Rhodomicrobium sp. Az07]|uniref:universal stress protein n=1 Tax=Rhodomicrobium sp. Az07 TaxID=2839034 RepID=UPI001BE6B3BE|nr:universal stress protein [Rhodomicrobium sp. Az07]MBT3069450.1 universal stress protein [Rhodomicrobium sp. Az07]
MPIKTILVYLPNGRTAAAILGPVVEIAASRSAHVIGLHLIPQVPEYGEFPADVSEEVISRIQKAGQDAAREAKQTFEGALQDSGLTFEWRCFNASYAAGSDAIVRNAHGADLVVCGAQSEDPPDAWSDFSEIALMGSGRPVLILPTLKPQKSVARNVIIAWNDTREAARAVFDSLDLIRDASTIRAVTVIQRESERAAAEALGADLIANLARHGIAASSEVAHAGEHGAAEAIKRLMGQDCDLLVMGGYSKSRFREMLFGGVSRDVLRQVPVATFVSH